MPLCYILNFLSPTACVFNDQALIIPSFSRQAVLILEVVYKFYHSFNWAISDMVSEA